MGCSSGVEGLAVGRRQAPARDHWPAPTGLSREKHVARLSLKSRITGRVGLVPDPKGC